MLRPHDYFADGPVPGILGAAVVAANRVFERNQPFPRGVQWRRTLVVPEADVPKSPFGANEQHECHRQAYSLRRPPLFLVSHHHTPRSARAASEAARCVTSGEKR